MEISPNEMFVSLHSQRKAGLRTRRNWTADPNKMPVQDEFSRGYMTMSRYGEVSVWYVFAYRIFLDIRDILGAHCLKQDVRCRTLDLSIFHFRLRI